MFSAAVRLAHDALATRRLMRENAELRAQVEEMRQLAANALQLTQQARDIVMQQEEELRQLRAKIASLERLEAERDTE